MAAVTNFDNKQEHNVPRQVLVEQFSLLFHSFSVSNLQKSLIGLSILLPVRALFVPERSIYMIPHKLTMVLYRQLLLISILTFIFCNLNTCRKKNEELLSSNNPKPKAKQRQSCSNPASMQHQKIFGALLELVPYFLFIYSYSIVFLSFLSFFLSFLLSFFFLSFFVSFFLSLFLSLFLPFFLSFFLIFLYLFLQYLYIFQK